MTVIPHCAANADLQCLSLRRRAARMCACIAATFLVAGQVEAGFLFDFNSLASGVNSATNGDPIETYMEGIYGSNISVLLGTKTLKSKPENVGLPNYLGNTDNLVWHANPKDTYLINRWNATSIASNLRDRITIIFEDVPVISIEFDWQIFPVTTGKADLTVKADGVTYFYFNNAPALRDGKLGHTLLTFATPVHKLEFIDWTTAPIGIDNLHVTAAPEPATWVLGLLGTVGLAAVRRRRSAA